MECADEDAIYGHFAAHGHHCTAAESSPTSSCCSGVSPQRRQGSGAYQQHCIKAGGILHGSCIILHEMKKMHKSMQTLLIAPDCGRWTNH